MPIFEGDKRIAFTRFIVKGKVVMQRSQQWDLPVVGLAMQGRGHRTAAAGAAIASGWSRAAGRAAEAVWAPSIKTGGGKVEGRSVFSDRNKREKGRWRISVTTRVGLKYLL